MVDRSALPAARAFYWRELGELRRADRKEWAAPKSGCPFHASESKKSFFAKRLLRGFSRKALELAAEQVDCQTVIEKLLRSKSERIRLETLSFLADRLWGRPMQAMRLSIGIEKLSTLSDAELEEYAATGVLPPLLEAASEEQPQ